MAWQFDALVDTTNRDGRVVARVTIRNTATGEKRTEQLWFNSTPNTATRNAAIAKLVAGIESSESEATGRRKIADRIEESLGKLTLANLEELLSLVNQALAAGVTKAQIATKLQNAIDGV